MKLWEADHPYFMTLGNYIARRCAMAGLRLRAAAPPCCHDCGRPYGDEHGFPDLVVSHEVWRRISPTGDEGGLLCPSCICQRLHAAGITTHGKFTSGPLSAQEED